MHDVEQPSLGSQSLAPKSPPCYQGIKRKEEEDSATKEKSGQGQRSGERRWARLPVLYSRRCGVQWESQASPLCIPHSSQWACVCDRTLARVHLGKALMNRWGAPVEVGITRAGSDMLWRSVWRLTSSATDMLRLESRTTASKFIL